MSKDRMHAAEKEPKASPFDFSKLMKNIPFVAAAVLIIGILIGGAIGASFFARPSSGTPAGNACEAQTIVAADIASRVESYINDNAAGLGLPEGTLAKNAKASNYNDAVYKIEFEISNAEQTQKVYGFAAVDGSLLLVGPGTFPSFYTVFNMNEPVPEQPEQEPIVYPKSDAPEVRLFVWSFCPGGTAGEAALKPVVDLLGSKIDAKVVYIGAVTTDKSAAAASCFAGQGKSQEDALKNCCATYTVDGNTVYSCALHNSEGNLNESYESARQACIAKYYTGKFWAYVEAFNTGCIGSSDIDSCWKEKASALGIDAAKIGQCAESAEGIKMLMEDSDLADGYDIHSSPTLIINGVAYTGNTTASGYKEAICSAFNTVPEECSQEVAAGSASNSNASCG